MNNDTVDAAGFRSASCHYTLNQSDWWKVMYMDLRLLTWIWDQPVTCYFVWRGDVAHSPCKFIWKKVRITTAVLCA